MGLHFLGDGGLLCSNCLVNSWESEDSGSIVLGGGLNLLGGGIWDFTLLQFTFVLWEKDELGLIVGQSLNVGILHISVLVVSSVINRDSNGLSESWSELGFLELSERESSTELNLTGILLGHSENKRSKLADWSWEHSGSFFGSFVGSDFLVSLFVGLGLIVGGLSWRWLHPDFCLDGGIGFACASLCLIDRKSVV